MSGSANRALVVVDIQREYVTEGRPFHIAGIGPSLDACAEVLAVARKERWPIVHVQHMQDGSIFNRNSDLSRFVEGFEPVEGEVTAIKSDFSSYSSETFCNFVKEHGGKELVIIGYGVTMCVMSTIIDGYHRGDKYALVSDATYSKTIESMTEASLHSHAVTILGTFARKTTTKELLAQ